MSLSEWSDSFLTIVIQGHSFRPMDVFEMAARATEGVLTTGYFMLLDCQISEFIFHMEVFSKVKYKLHPNPDKASQIGGYMEWEEVGNGK
jgi:hypothetical protein